MSAETSWLGSMPAIYDRCLGPALFAPYAEHLASLAADSGEPRRVLELAAGSGIATAALVRALPGASILATDLNPAMVEWGRAQVPSATWQVADAHELGPELAAGDVDLVVCQFGVMFFPDRRLAYAQVRRALAPSGRFLFTTWDVVEGSPFTAALMQSLHVLFPDDPPTFVARVPHGYTDADLVTADLRAAGLEPDRVERTVLTGRSPSARTVAEGFCRGTPLRFELQQRGDLDELTAAIGDHMTTLLGEGSIEGDLAAIVVSARTTVS